MNGPITRRAAIAALAAAAAVRPSQALQGWPDRSVTLVHGTAPGRLSDVVARIVADNLTRRVGQSVVVDARPGAGGRLAAGQVARSAPDGYTLMMVPSEHAVAAALYRSLPYRPVDDFTPISMVAEAPLVLVISAASRARNFAEFAASARARAAPMLFASAGNGSIQHLAGETLSRTLNVTFQHVPYRGTPQALTDLIAQRIDFMVDSPSLEMRAIRAGRVRPLMVTSAARFFGLPQVPTAAEVDLPTFTFTEWFGIVGPAGMPEPLVDRLTTEIAGVLADPEVADRIRSIGFVPTATSPKDLRQRIRSDIERWIEVVENTAIERI